MIQTTSKIATPHGVFEAQWDDDEEIPVNYAGNPEAISHFKSCLAMGAISARGGALVRFESLEPDDLLFLQPNTYGITVMQAADDLTGEDDNEETDMQQQVILDSAGEAQAFTLIGEGAQLLTNLDEGSETFFADLGRLREIVAALGDGALAAPAAEGAALALTMDERVAQASELGTQAFADGKDSTPALNQDLAALLSGLQPGDGLTVIQAYSAAWNAANAAAPVPGVSDSSADAAAAPVGATREQAKAALATLRPFMSAAQMRAFTAPMRGEEAQAFFDKAVEMASVIDTMPATYQTSGEGNSAVVQLHYLKGGSDWYITEKDMEGDGTIQAFGFSVLNGDMEMAELGYISIQELVQAGAELDLYWTKKTLAAVRGIADSGQAAEPAAAAPEVEPVAEVGVDPDAPATVQDALSEQGDRTAEGMANLNAVVDELGGTLSAWATDDNWQRATLTVAGVDLIVGVSTGGVVAVNGHPFTPDDQMNITLPAVRASILAALPAPAIGGQPNEPEQTVQTATDPVVNLAQPLPEGQAVEVPPETQPDEAPNDTRLADLAYLSGVKTSDMDDETIPDQIEAIISKYASDTEVEQAAREAINAYTDHWSKAIAAS